jgi:hypothetical protein
MRVEGGLKLIQILGLVGPSYKSLGTSALKKVHRLRVFEKRMLRRIFGRKRDEVMQWRTKLHREKRKNYIIYTIHRHY